MSHKAFYRKYRPCCFNDIIGQNHIITTLKNAIKLNRINHAYIFCGPKGIGKTSIAKIFARAVNCLHPIDGDICQECENCKLANTDMDILELDAASNNGVDDVRKIISNVQFRPMQLKYKVYIVDEAHMLSVAAWNSFLKTIEESPEYAIFIFATTEMHKIPSTVVSRCQYFQFWKFTNEQIEATLNRVVSAENIKIEEAAIKKIVSLANGSARDCLTILDQLFSLTNNDIKLNDVKETFGLIDDEQKIEFLNTIINNDANASITMLDKFIYNGANLITIVEDIMTILLDKLAYIQSNSPTTLKYYTVDLINKINIDKSKLIDLIEIWQQQYHNIRTSSDSRLYYELAIFKSIRLLSNESNKTVVVAPTVQIPTSIPNIPTPIIPPVNKTKFIEIDKSDVNDSDIFKFEEIPLVNTSVSNPVQKDSAPPNIKQPNNDFVTRKINISASVPTKQVVTNSTLERIAHNSSKENRAKIMEKMNILKTKVSDVSYNDPLTFLKKSKQTLYASNNGFVVTFINKQDADYFNKNATNPVFVKAVKECFGKALYIVALTHKDAIAFDEQLRSNGRKEMAEPDVSLLENETKDNASDIARKFGI